MKKLEIKKEPDIFKKIQKRILLDTIDIYDFEGDLNQAIKRLEDCKDEQYNDYNVGVEADFDNSDDGYAQIHVYGYREETDKELDMRIDAHNKEELRKYLYEQEQKAKKKEQYLALKEEFENES